MKRFDRHIIRRLVSGYVMLTVGLIVFFILLHYLEYVDDFIDREAPMREIFLIYYPSYIPEIIRLTSPLALFLACIYLTGKLAQELQLVALQTSGVSLYRLMVPYVLVAAAVSGGMVWFNGWIVPKTNRIVLSYDEQYLKGDAPRQLDVNGIHRQNLPGSYLSITYFDRRDSSAVKPALFRFDGERLVERLDGQRMRWVDSLGAWRISDAVIRHFPKDGVERREEVARMDTVLQIYPWDLARTERDIESMTVPVAADYLDALRRSGAADIGRPLVGYYTKFSYPLANLLLILIGVPLAAVRRRGGQAVQIGLGLGTAFAYLAAQKLTEPFGYSGELSPELTAWLPHMLFFAVAVFMLAHARK